MSIDDFHADIRERILAGEAGLAQSMVGPNSTSRPYQTLEVLTSYDARRSPATFSHAFAPYEDVPENLRHRIMILDMALDVAAGRGIASARTFPRSEIEFQARDLAKWNEVSFPGKRAASLALTAFYLAQGAPGAHLLR